MSLEDFDSKDVHGKLHFIAHAYTILHNQIIQRRLPSDDDIIYKIQKLLGEMAVLANRFSQDTKEREVFRMPDEFVELIGMMKFIAKRMDGIEKRFEKIEDGDINHKIKIIVDSSDADRYSNREKNHDPYEELLNSIPHKFSKVLIMRFGIYGKQKSNTQIGNSIAVSPATVTKIIKQGLRMCAKISCHAELPECELKSRILEFK
jgi:DNA-directed RNA polymerase sigma subunit (sigma70/sigma32)